MEPRKILVVFPHGLGDAVMATPAFRSLRKQYPKASIDIAIQPITRNSRLLDRCPYFDNIHTISNPWHSRRYDQGMHIARMEVDKLVDFYGHQEVKWVYHRQDIQKRIHKAFLTAKELSVDLHGDTDYEVFVSKKEEEDALSWLKCRGYALGDYAFVHCDSSDLRKNISLGDAGRMLPADYKNRIVTVGQSFDVSEHSIGFAITLLRHAGFTLLVDSVFVHCADALRKDIDIHITNARLLEINRPLHINARQLVVKEFARGSSLQQQFMNAYYRLRPRFKTIVRIWSYPIKFRSCGTSAIRVEALKQSFRQPGSPNPSLYIFGLAILVIVHQYIVIRPYAAYLRINDRGWHFLGSESTDPIPLEGIKLLQDLGSRGGRSIQVAVKRIQRAINKIIDARKTKDCLWVGEYDLELGCITNCRTLTNHQIRLILSEQEPFASDRDVANCFDNLFALVIGSVI